MSDEQIFPISHDQLFKNLIKARFEDLLKLVVPQLAARLHASEAEFLDKETFTDLPQGTRNELDLVARLPTDDDQTELILVHLEIEGDASSTMGKRLWRYNLQLELRHDTPVIPIVVYLRGGKPDVQQETFTRAALSYEINTFRYLAFGLSPSVAEEYLARPEPLAWALAALMRAKHLPPEELRAECLKRVAEADLPEAHKFLLLNCVETYLILSGEAKARYERLLQREEYREVEVIEQTWAEQMIGVGFEKGARQTLREVLLSLLEQKFGSLPEATKTKVCGIESKDELQMLISRVLSAGSLDDLSLSH